MGSYDDGAEICEQVGIYILTRLATIIKNSECGLYRDDGLVTLRNVKTSSKYLKMSDLAMTWKLIQKWLTS